MQHDAAGLQSEPKLWTGRACMSPHVRSVCIAVPIFSISFESELLFETPPVHSLRAFLSPKAPVWPLVGQLAAPHAWSVCCCLVLTFNFSAVFVRKSLTIINSIITIPPLANFQAPESVIMFNEITNLTAVWIAMGLMWVKWSQEIVLLAGPEAIVAWASRIMLTTVSISV